MGTGVRGASAVLAMVTVLVGSLVACEPVPPLPTIGCERAAERIQLTTSAQLDPACTYTAGVDITASGTTLDCKGATIAAPNPSVGGVGVLISAPVGTSLGHVAVRNCTITGFLNNLRVTRPGFKALPAGGEYGDALTDIVIEDSHLSGAAGTGLYVDGYVTGVTVQRVDIGGSGGAGIYLEAGSVGTTIRDDVIHDNGFAGTVLSTFTFNGTTVKYRSRGREGIAVDGSRRNVIVANQILRNAAGGVYLYKNCGEYATQKPDQWWTRRYGADDNTISGNTIVGGRVGVWVGSRMSENLVFMDCSDPVIASTGPLNKVYADHAARTVVAGNVIGGTTWGVRVEDDATVVSGNRFVSLDPAGAAVAVGTSYRTALGHPVTGTAINANQTDAGPANDPYRWQYGQSSTTVEGNTAAGQPADFVTGTVLQPDVAFPVQSIIL